MTPAQFPEANHDFGPPVDMAESQVQTVPGFCGQVVGGSCDGCRQIVVAYDLTPEEIEHLRTNPRIFLSFLGGIPPHYLSFDFESATHPA